MSQIDGSPLCSKLHKCSTHKYCVGADDLRCFGALQLLENKVPRMVLQLPALRLVVSCVGVAGSVVDLSQVCQEWQAWTDSLSPKVPECNEGSSWSQGCVLEASFGMLSKILSPENP